MTDQETRQENQDQRRFEMIKARHKKTLLKAIEDKKADEPIIPDLLEIAEMPNYYTSSSCSGRSILLGLTEDENKLDSKFLFKKHGIIKDFEKVWKIVNETEQFPNIWLKSDAFIFHFGANGLDCSRKVLEVSRKAGIRRAGIMLAEDGKFMLEVIGSQSMNVPVKLNGKVLIEKDLFFIYLETANKKMEKNYEHLRRFLAEFKKLE